MGNPIYASDLYKDDGAITEAIKQLESLGKAHEDQLKKIGKEAISLEAKVKGLNVTTSAGRDEIKKTSTEADKLAKAYSRLEEAQSDVGKQIAAVNEEKRKTNQINKLEAKLNASLEGSYDNLAAQYGLAKIRLNEMGEATAEARKEKRKLEEEANNLYDRMKQLQEATGKHTLSVGDYGKALREVGGPIGSAVDGVENLGGSLRALLANPVVAFIALITAALVGLFRAFKQSEKGAESMAKATAVLSSLWSNVIELAADLADRLVEAFEDPKQAVKDFGKFIGNNLLNRLKAILDVGGAIGKMWKAIFQRDLDGIKQAAEDAGRAGVQMITGFDADQQRDFASAVRETTEEVLKEAEAFAGLAAAKLAIKRQNREITKTVENLTTAEAKYRAVADDTTKSFKERNEAAEQAREALEARAAQEIRIAKNNLSLVNQEISLRRANREDLEGLLDQQLSAYQALRGAEREYTLATLDNQRTRNELRQDELERDLDILIDGFDNQKTINEKRIADDRLSFEERQRILEETQRLSDDSFAKQIETIQQFTDVQVNANELITESDAVALNEKIRSLGLSEIIEGRLLEIVRDRKSTNQDLADAERDLADARAKFANDEKLRKERELADQRAAELEAFDQEQELAEVKFELLKSTEAEKTKFALEQEIDRYKKLIDINERLGGELSDVQVETLKNRVLKAQQELEGLSAGGGGLFDKLGLKLTPEQKEGLTTSFQFAKDQLMQYSQARQEAAGRAVDAANQEVASVERALNAEIEAARAGEANRVETVREELALAKKAQQESLNEQKRAAREQQIIEAAQQASSLITASAKIWAQLGFPAALPGLAVMWGSFAASKIRAFRDTKIFRDGGLEMLEGGSHASGNDIPLYTGKDGVQRRAEGGEAMMIVSRKGVRKYGGILPMVEQALNRGFFEDVFQQDSSPGQTSVSVQQMAVDTGRMERTLESIDENGRARSYVDGDGRLVEIRGNIKTTYL